MLKLIAIVLLIAGVASLPNQQLGDEFGGHHKLQESESDSHSRSDESEPTPRGTHNSRTAEYPTDRSTSSSVQLNDTRPSNSNRHADSPNYLPTPISSLDYDIETTSTSPDSKPLQMINIPANVEQIIAKLNDNEFQDHVGLQAARIAIQNKRSPKNAYILFLGLAGAGKSSTINFLFGKEVAGVSATISTKSQIIEYAVDVPIPQLGIQNSQLRIIDTPGLGSSRGVEHDARIIATLQNYLSNHEELKDALPNTVLIFSKFDDNRMQGTSSNFVKMLKGYNMVRKTFVPADENEPSNIIYVLTRFLSETKRVQRNPSQKLEAFTNVIKNYTTFPSPIILSVADNEAAEEELQQVGDDYKLLNNELYPKNLIDRIQNISTGSAGNQLALEIFKTAFAKRKSLNITKISTVELLEGGNQKVLDTSEQIKANDFPIHKSEVSDALKVADETIDPDLKKSYPASLQLLQRAFQIRNIKNITQIPTKRSEVVTFLQGSNMNPAMIALFEKAFTIKIPEFQFDLVTGYGFDVLKDESLPNSPFEFESVMKFSKMGFMIPDGITAEPINEESNILHFFKGPGEYMNFRIRELGLQDETNEETYEAEYKTGYNVMDSSSTLPQVQITSTREIRKFQLTLNERVPFNEKFKEALDEMPAFSISDRDSVSEWNSLFQDYGTHVVGSAYGGGEIETIVNLKGEELRKLRSGEMENVKNAISKLPHNSGYSKEFENSLEDSKINIRLKGGDYKFGKLKLENMQLEEIIENVDKWKQTLGYEAIMLKSKLLIIPLSEIIKQVNPTVAIEMQKATKEYLLKGSIEYTPLPTVPTTQKSDIVETHESNLQILDSLNQTLRDLQMKRDRQREEYEENKRRYLTLLTTQAPIPTSTSRGWTRTSTTTTKPVDNHTMIQRATDYIWNRIHEIPKDLFQKRARVLAILDKIDAGNLTSDELSPENLNKLVELAKLEPTSRPIPLPDDRNRNRYPTANTQSPKYGQGRSNPSQPSGNNHHFKGPGYSYDMNRDTLLPNSPFELSQNSSAPTKVRENSRIAYIHTIYSNTQVYINNRTKDTNANIYISKNVFSGDVLPGYGVGMDQSSYSIVKEYREWSVALNQIDKLSVANHFKETLRNLRPYHRNDCESANQWRHFFNQYGTHIVSSAYMGGAVEFVPYGETLKEIISAPSIHRYFETVNLDHKKFDCRVIGGNPENRFSRESVTSQDLRLWSSTVTDRMVMLPTLIKLIPIHELVEVVQNDSYRDSLKAFNDYFDGKLKACDVGIQCGPSRSVTNNGQCACPAHQTLIDNQCKTLEGRQCSLDSWDDCVPNSVCFKYDENYGKCKCREGYDISGIGLCYKSYRTPCDHSSECDRDAALACNSGYCYCAHSDQSYNFQKNRCLSWKNYQCGQSTRQGIRYSLDCESGFVCQRETQKCV